MRIVSPALEILKGIIKSPSPIPPHTIKEVRGMNHILGHWEVLSLRFRYKHKTGLAGPSDWGILSWDSAQSLSLTE